MAMKMNEMIKMLADAGSDGGSKLHMRSEKLQNKQRVARIPMLKNALKKKSKLLVLTELAFPFNPETGEADDTFNSDTKWRPPFSATTTALAMKSSAAENETLKKKLMDRAGIENWDTSDPDTFTKEDWAVFAPYRVPRVFTVVATHVNIPAMGTGVFGRDYAVSVDRNDQGEIVGEKPNFLKISKFFRDKCYEEYSAYQAKVKSGELNHTDKQQQDERQRIYSQVPVSDDQPRNFVQIIELPMNKTFGVDDDTLASVKSVDGVKGLERISKIKKGIRIMLDHYKNGEYVKYDKFFDFYEIDMSCPTDGDDSTNRGKAAIGQETTYEKPATSLSDRDEYGDNLEKVQGLISSVREMVDKNMKIEEEVRASVMIPVLDESVERQIFQTVSTVINLENDEWITKKVAKENAEIISLIFGDRGDEFLESLDAGLVDAAEGNLDSDASKAEAKSYDLSSEEFNENVDAGTEDMGDFDSVDLSDD